jgi:2-oxoisovalerate dehydrogenase E2 component (dihydrolipoyl transacylase)
MGETIIKLPDVGEGVAEAELVEWHVEIGDVVREDMVLAAVMTGKATVEIPSPVEGEITWRHGEVGDVIATGTVILKIRTSAGDGGDAAAGEGGEGHQPDDWAISADEAPASPEPAAGEENSPAHTMNQQVQAPHEEPLQATGMVDQQAQRQDEGDRPLASPAVRLRAKQAGVDLRQIVGSGPSGRITHDDLDAHIGGHGRAPSLSGLRPNTDVREVKVVGLRRRIAEKMALAKSPIPHITYVEEVDMTALEELRARLNSDSAALEAQDRPRLTILPFLMRAMVKAIAEQPELNAHFDDEAGVVRQFGGVHIGVAAQTPAGLVVPVLRHAEARDLFDCAREVARLSEAARNGTAQREELSGSTITISSLGAMGGIVSTPVINHPEVAIIGVNKLAIRPHWDGMQFVPRKMMNLSSSFDHRVIDGWDAASFIQRLKVLLEAPGLIYGDA